MRKFLLLFFIIFCVGIYGCGPKEYSPEEQAEWPHQAGEYPANYEALVKDYLKYKLFDPFSAQYIFKEPSIRPCQNRGAWIGTVMINAKNRMGAYTGFKQNWYIIRHSVVLDVSEFQYF